jgi:hypothetical protein
MKFINIFWGTPLRRKMLIFTFLPNLCLQPQNHEEYINAKILNIHKFSLVYYFVTQIYGSWYIPILSFRSHFLWTCHLVMRFVFKNIYLHQNIYFILVRHIQNTYHKTVCRLRRLVFHRKCLKYTPLPGMRPSVHPRIHSPISPNIANCITACNNAFTETGRT